MPNNEWNNELKNQLTDHPDADLFVSLEGKEIDVADVVYDPQENCIEVVGAASE